MAKRYIITKYALTTGVLITSGKVCNDEGTMLQAGRAGYYHKPDWHTDAASAVDQIHKMRTAAVRSTQEKLSKLEAFNADEAVAQAKKIGD
jgi:hypothetical protein